MEFKDDSGVSVHTSKQDEAETSLIASSNPVVFQCSQCDAIVGDSMSWVSANKIMRTITLGRVTSKVGVKSEIQISQSGVDKGSTYSAVYCISCNEVLGKQYLASPPELDYIRGSFTIHVEKLNRFMELRTYLEKYLCYEVGSAQTSGTSSDLADMLNVPSPGHLMARVNKMQFLIVSMNDRIKKLEACHTDGESAGKTAGMEHSDKTGSCTLGETESVSSSDNFSTKPRTFSSGSDFTDVFDAGYRQNVCSNRQDMLKVRPLLEQNFGNFERNLEQQTRAVNRNNELAHKDRVVKRAVRSNVDGSRQVNPRSPQNGHIDSVLDDGRDYEMYADRDYEETENFRQSQQRKRGRKGSKEHLEMNQQRGGNERSDEQTNTELQAAKHDMSSTKSTNVKRREINQETVINGIRSPNVRGPMSRKQSSMETWPSPGMDRKGRDSKKRKIMELNDRQ